MRTPNTSRLTAALFVAFCSFFFDGRQPICIRKNKNHLKISRCEMLCSFYREDFCRDKANTAENTSVLSRCLTQYRRKSSCKNRLVFDALNPKYLLDMQGVGGSSPLVFTIAKEVIIPITSFLSFNK